MRIVVGRTFTYNNNEYKVIRVYGEQYKYDIKKYSKRYNGWVYYFSANTINKRNIRGIKIYEEY